ncbi:MAG: Proteasome-activating nucleotidase [Candidatus Heimdallarchaeota archaeon LC_3]|nr:MAG: Proteasome-activating nucleotidase [Candidatus Heimdallarchaeota archaeon LC_3]
MNLSYNEALKSNLKGLEDDQRRLIHQRNSFQKQLEKAKGEIARLTREPLLIGVLVETLENMEQAIVKSSNGPTFVVNISPDIEVEDLVPGNRVVLNQRTFTVIKLISSPIDPFVRGMEVDEKPTTSYSDIGGLDKQIEEVRESIELSLKNPELFEKVGIESPKGVLLYGPPGSGKTLIAKAVAHETNATFISINGSEFVQKYIGEGARLVRELFQFAHKNAPAIIFIDEIDAIGSHRLDIATGGDREVARTFMQLLAEMDGFKSRGNVKIIGATNRIDILDDALTRAGRFDRHIFIDSPNVVGRLQIFKIHTEKMAIKEIDFNALSKITDGLNGAEIRNICQEAGMRAIRNNSDNVVFEDFIFSVNKIKEKKKRGEPTISGFYY